MPPHLLVLDVGTSSVRASLYDAENSSLIDGTRRTTHDWPIETRLDPEAWRRDAAEPAIRELLERNPRANVVKIGFACFAMSMIGLSREGNAVTKLYSYATVLDSEPRLATTNTPALSPSVLNRLGVSSPYHASYAYFHIDALARESPAIFSNVAQFVSLPSYLVTKWCGLRTGIPVSFSEASWWGLFDSRELRWEEETSGKFLSRLPPVMDWDEFEGTASQFMKSRLGSAKIYLGLGDGGASSLGALPTSAVSRMMKSYDEGEDNHGGEIVVNIGTSCACRVLQPRRSATLELPRGLFRYVVNRDLYVVGGALSDGGGVLNWFDSVSSSSYGRRPEAEEDEDDDDVAAISDLVVIPNFSPGGERSMRWDSGARSLIYGLQTDRHVTANHVRKAIILSISIRLKVMRDAILAHTSAKYGSSKIYASGNALAKNKTWTKIMSRCLDADILSISSPLSEGGIEEEATTRGVVRAMVNLARFPTTLSSEERPRPLITLASRPRLDFSTMKERERELNKRKEYAKAIELHMKIYDVVERAKL